MEQKNNAKQNLMKTNILVKLIHKYQNMMIYTLIMFHHVI